MLEISITKVEDPGCLWGRVLKGPGLQSESPQEYDDLQVKMNLFYHEVDLDVQKVKPVTLEEGQVCVVFCPDMKSWCRATVESLFLGSVKSRAMCFLVDHGERVVVRKEDLRAPLDKFLLLPFRMQRFQLARIHPLRLEVSICRETAQLVPSLQWDSSATKYLHNLLQASTLAEAVLCETHANCTAIELYLTIRNVKVTIPFMHLRQSPLDSEGATTAMFLAAGKKIQQICVNDDLVVKKFACFSSGKAMVREEQGGSVDHSPLSLAWDIFSSPHQILEMNGCCTVRPPSHFLTRKSENAKSPSRELAFEQLEHLKTNVTSQDKSPESLKVLGPVGTSSLQNHGLFNGVSEADGSTRSLELKKSKTCSLEQTEDTESSLTEQLSQRLSLVRFLKFLNPFSHSNVICKPDEDEQNQSISDETAEKEHDIYLVPQPEEDSAVCLDMAQPVNSSEQNGFDLSGPSDMPDTTAEQQEPASCQKPNVTDQLVCARLLQLLNPDPLNPELEHLDDDVVGSTRRGGVLVHSVIPVSPCSSLSRAPITAHFREFLLRRNYRGLSQAESYCWPPVARGCDTLLVSPAGDDPLSYLPPLLAQLQLTSVFSTFTTHTGPVAVILCPGWEKVKYVLDLLEQSKAAGNLHPAAVLLGLGKDEAKQAKIQNNCLLLVTTPFSLVRMLEVHCFLFLRLCHLVLDEAHELYSRAPDQMASILEHFKKVVSREERGDCPRQIVAVGGRWSQALEGMVREHMLNPSIIVTVTKEAALYGGVHQMVLLCLDCNKTSVLLSSLDFNPSVPQKTLIITNSVEEVEHVYKAVSHTAAFSLKVHEGLTYQFDFVVEHWNKDIGPGTQVILVTTNDCMKALGIRDATCVVHYGFPSSPKVFGNRLFCMSDNYRNLSEKCSDGGASSSPVLRSVVLLSERNASHVSGVLRYLRRAGALLPTELLHFAQGVQQAREENKTNRALCSRLKSLGFCRDSTVCPDRHAVNKTIDRPLHPVCGSVLVLPLYIKSASVYFGRIVNHKEDPYETLAAEMSSHYAKEKLIAKEVVERGLYAVQEEDVYHRVCVTKVHDGGNHLFSSVTAHFVDEGRIQEVKSHLLLQLPPEFQCLPSQAVEIILCRVQPIDGEVDWHPKVTRAISMKIKGRIHQAKVVMCLGNTVWVDPMVCMTRMPGLKTFINEYNILAEVLATGMGTTNPQHLELLRQLCLEEQVSAAEQSSLSGSISCEGEVASLEVKVQAAEEDLASRMKASLASLCSVVELPGECGHGEPCETTDTLEAPNQIAESNGGSSTPSLEALLVDNEKVVSFHPQIKWFQAEESVTLKIKLLDPINQKFEFFPNRVFYSAYMNNRHYCADLDLHSDISTEQCSWEIKCSEPVIKLMKKKKEEWKSLLKYKSTFVSYDFDHIEDEETHVSKPVSNGRRFLADTGESDCYVNSESESESD